MLECGGLYQNHPYVFRNCQDVDVACLIKTFLEDDTSAHLRIPPDSHFLFVPGKRGPQSRRTSGGFALLIKNSVASPANCSFVEHFPGICVANLHLAGGADLSIVVVYRAAESGTPLYNEHFYRDLVIVLDSCSDRKTLIVGDFNTKLGDQWGPLGVLDFAADILPAVAESTKVVPHAEDLFNIFVSAQLYLFFNESNGIVQDTFMCRGGRGAP